MSARKKRLIREEGLRLKKLVKRSKQRKKRRFLRKQNASIKKTSLLLPLLYERLKADSREYYHKDKGAWVIEFPRVFCLIENPHESLNTIYSLLSAAKKGTHIYFDQSKCESIGISASAIFDVIAMALRNEGRLNRQPYRFSGKFPKDIITRNVIKLLGVTKHLGISTSDGELKERLIKFELFEGRKPSGIALRRMTDQERAASRLVRYIDECLKGATGFKLSIEGQRKILKWVGEIVTNAEDHSGQGRWYAIGYMVPCMHGDEPVGEGIIGECHLAIFNFGKSVFESLKDANTPAQTLIQIEGLAKKHAERKFFISSGYEPEDLWTLYALQDGVSRFSARPGSTTRGKGTVDMIEAFQGLGKTIQKTLTPRMSLVSGSSFILFDGKYHMAPRAVENGTRMIIAFNESNDLDERPDGSNVKTIKPLHFPGTVLSFKFYLDRKHLEGIKNGKT